MARGRIVGKGPPPPPDREIYKPPRVSKEPEIVHPGSTERTAAGWQQRELVLPHPDGKRWLLYGHQRVGGKIQFAHLAANGDLWLVIELCAGECDALLGVTSDGVAFNPGYLSQYMQYWWYPGTAAGQVDTNLAAVLPGWNEQFAGTSYVVCRLISFTGVWEGRIGNFVWEMRTRKPLNPDTQTYVYSTNPFDQWYDFLRWDEGKKLPASRIVTSSFVTAKAIANETFGAPARKRFESHMHVMEKVDPDDVIRAFRLMTDSFWFWDANQFRVVVDRPGAAVATYGDRHVDRKTPISGERSDIVERPNSVTMWFTDTVNGWKRAPITVKSPALEAGTEEPIEVEYEVPWIHDAGMARSRAVYILNSHQFDLRIKERWLMATADRQLGDIVTRSIPSRGLNYTGRLLRRKKNSNNTFDVELFEYNAAKFSDDIVTIAAKTPSTLPAAGDAPDDVNVGLVAITEEPFQEQPGTWKTRGRIALTNPNSNYFSHVELWVSLAGGEYRFVKNLPGGPGVAVTDHFNGITEVNKAYTFKFISVSKFNVKSAGVTKVKTFDGKITPPRDLLYLLAAQRAEKVCIQFQPSTDRDYTGIEIRRGTTTDTWETALRVAKTLSHEWWDEPPIGTWRYFGKAFDGIRYSTNAKTADVTVFFYGAETLGERTEGWEYQGSLGYAPWEQYGDAVVYDINVGRQSPGFSRVRIIEGVSVRKTLTAMLCRDRSTAQFDTEIATGGYASIQQWETAVDAPLRTSPDGVVQGIWAPLPADECFGQFDSGILYVGSSKGWRNADFKFRAGGRTKRIGYDVPTVTTRAETINDMEFLTGVNPDPQPSPVRFGAEGCVVSLGLRLGTNNKFAQTIFTEIPWSAAFVRQFHQAFPKVLSDTDIVSAAPFGQATATFPKPMPTGVPAVEVQVVAGGPAVWSIIALDGTQVTIGAFDPVTGLSKNGVTLRVSAQDRGGGGTSSFGSPAD